MGCGTWERMGKPHGQFDVVITAHNGDSVRPAFLFLSVCECYSQVVVCITKMKVIVSRSCMNVTMRFAIGK